MSTTRRVASRAKSFIQHRTPAHQAQRSDATPMPSSIKGDDRSRSLPRILKPSDIRVIYTDKHLTVLSKPSGLVGQPDASTPNGLELAYSAVRSRLSLPRSTSFHPVHRLDRLTTGCMLLPTSPTLARDLSQQIASRKVEKSYLCLARGGAKSFLEREGIIEEKLLLEDGRVRVARKGEEGTDTMTKWEVIASSPKVPLSLLRLHPVTGHKHQLRVHCSFGLKAPVLGDVLHAKSRLPSSIAGLSCLKDDWMYLHAAKVSFWRFVKPTNQSASRVRLTIAAPIPEEWRKICREIDIPLESEMIRGGLWVDGEEPSNGAVEGLFGKWLG